ncbi:cyclase [Rhodobacteraceae bacterium WD3A24]|nr:cyclase [Rhodobacteraceae bacterium WD3A24]
MTVTRAAIYEAADKLSNWGRWGKDDQIGTLNNIGPDEITAAGRLIRQGKVFGLGLPLDVKIQTGLFGGRWNPIHTFLATGTDAYSGNQAEGGLQYADDALNMPIQGSTHWDSLNHIFLDGKMYNGHDARLVDSKGGAVNGIENSREKMVGRGVLLDLARFKGVDCLEDGYAITNADLDACAAAQGVEIRKGDFVIFRTGQQEKCLREDDWSGYAGGDAPGVAFENCYWLKEKDVAGICSDTWGIEVRPNETSEVNQPWHWVVIPAIGITMGEIFYLEKLAEDCAADGVYEFFFTAPPLNLPGATGSPINPQAIK